VIQLDSLTMAAQIDAAQRIVVTVLASWIAVSMVFAWVYLRVKDPDGDRS